MDARAVLITIGLVMLLIMLRLEAEKFGTAEYYEATRDGERPRSAGGSPGTGLGFALVIAILFVHPSPQADLFLGSGDRIRAVVGGIAYGLLGVLVAVSFATFRYHRIRFPDSLSYPGALLNSVATAFIDEATFRGALFGLLLATDMNPSLANLIQAVIYAHHDAARSARARSLPAAADARDGTHRRLADRVHRRHRGRVPRPRHHPFRCLHVHRPHRPDEAAAAARSRRSRSAAGRPRDGG